MKKYNVDIVGIGDPFLDLVTHIEMLPKSNTNCKMHSHCFQGGGVVATALVAAARLGLKAALVGSVGDDLFGKLSLSDLKYNNVDVSFMKVAEGKKSNFSVCLTEQAIGGKEFIVYTGNADEVSPNELDEELIKSAKIVHCGLMNDTAIKACELIHSVGGKVSIDAPYFREHVYNNYKHYDIFICSEMYYDQMCKELNLDATAYEQNLKLIQAQGPDIVIATFGEKGSKGVYGDNYLDVPAYSVKAVDTTGAGDVFHGAFDYFYLQGMSVEDCIRYSSAVSAIKCTRPGGRAGIPTVDVVEKFIKTGEIDYSEIDTRVAHYQGEGIEI
jgi:sugar/nucleoside kinase (ribokinase family)